VQRAKVPNGGWGGIGVPDVRAQEKAQTIVGPMKPKAKQTNKLASEKGSGYKKTTHCKRGARSDERVRSRLTTKKAEKSRSNPCELGCR